MAGLSLCQAQKSAFKQELAVGASFGVNFSSVSFTPRVPTKMKLGFNGGATIRWNTEPNLGLQAELNFTQHGWEEKFETKPEYKYSRTINYVELPFLTHIHFGSKRVRVFVNLGPKVGYAFGESTDSNIDNVEQPHENRENAQHKLELQKRFDWGLCGGPGIEIRTGIGSFLLEGRYYYALGDIFNSHKGDTFSKSSSQIISAKLTYLIPIISK
ncbi:MAG: porin family protein [Parabacteroides sp.]|nr:porin family protein [Parabacteroides sp.]